MNKDEVLKALSSDFSGLTDDEGEEKLSSCGKNIITGKKKKGIIRRFIAQFADFSILALIIASALSYGASLMGGENDFTEPLIILAIVIVNAVIGIVQESRADAAIDALKSMIVQKCTVLRGGVKKEMDSALLVPGDIIYLKAGDKVPADARILSSASLYSDESALTGESLPVEKSDCVLRNDTPVSERTNCLYSSSLITAGHAVCVVTETGMNTAVGRLAGMISEEKEVKTPLSLKLARTGKVMAVSALLCCILLFFVGVLKKYDPLFMFMTAVSLAVAAIPEGLSAIVTVMLALSVSKMAKKKAVVRNLSAVETLGSATCICSDKTGTLTENRMTVKEVSGDRECVLMLMALCSDGVENPTEKAIIESCKENKTDLDKKYVRIDEIPFSSSRKRMLTVNKLNSGYMTLVKGAFDIILPFCSYVYENGGKRNLAPCDKEKLRECCEDMASRGMRVIALAAKKTSAPEKSENNLTFIGMVALSDPLRKEAYSAVRLCRKAGIRVIMITGDHKSTAKAIAEELSIAKGGVLTGEEIDLMDDGEFMRAVNKVSVFARVLPEHKVRIVKALKSLGHIVAMTGDGVNDAPALSAADIGCAMGKGGTEVARSASDMVLTDDNFATIVTAVAEGRVLFDNIKNAIHFLLSSNIGEVFLMMAGFFMGNGAILYPVELLWVNLITDSLPAISLGLDKGDRDIMLRKPKNPQKGFFSDGLFIKIVLEGLLIGVTAYAAFVYGNTRVGGGEALGRTMAFCTLSISQLIHAFSVRSERSVFSTEVPGNKWLNISLIAGVFLQYISCSAPFMCNIFKTVSLDVSSAFKVMLFSLVPLLVSEVSKLTKKGI
ncbi:MAG: cation-translocating P-type ATPase [Clostridia bacterium]|nr:cation-translocating P-type ATPase [Clostridia bacterium]